MASVADEVAALRGTKSATFKDPITHPPFARLLGDVRLVSGDWVGFLAVATLVADLAGGAEARSPWPASYDARTLPPCCSVRSRARSSTGSTRKRS